MFLLKKSIKYCNLALHPELFCTSAPHILPLANVFKDLLVTSKPIFNPKNRPQRRNFKQKFKFDNFAQKILKSYYHFINNKQFKSILMAPDNQILFVLIQNTTCNPKSGILKRKHIFYSPKNQNQNQNYLIFCRDKPSSAKS